jgi:hypothetical protein
MTTFMARVADAVGGDVSVDRPSLRTSVAKTVPVGADEQMVLRSIAEQLVSEANAVLPDGAPRIELTDRLVADQLGFTMSCGPRTVVVKTRFDGGVAVGELQGFGATCGGSVELAGPDELERLILLLLTGTSSD